MSRPLRILQEGAFYHVMNKGIGDAYIFFDKKDYENFLKTAKEACGFFNVQIIAYCLMSTHYHLLVHTPQGNLPRFMRHVNGVYTQRKNQKHKTNGPLFKGRYRAIIVQDQKYLLKCIRYIHLNPVKAKVVDLKKSEAYSWSSHKDYLRGSNDEKWLDVETALKQFDANPGKAIDRYFEYIKAGNDKDTKEFYEAAKISSIFGTDQYIDAIKENYLKSPRVFNHLEIPEARKIENAKRVKVIFSYICREFKVRPEDLSRIQRGKSNLARKFAICLLKELTQMRNREIADLMRLGSYKTPSAHWHRLHRIMDDDQGLRKRYQNLLERCGAGQDEV